MIKIFLGSLGGVFVKGLLPLIVVPILIGQWGEQDYAIWLESMAVAAFLILLGLGLNNFGVNRCQIAFKQNLISKNKIYDSLLSLNILLYLIASIISVIYVTIIDYFLSFEDPALVYIFGIYNAATILNSYINLSFRIIEKFHISLYLSIAYNIMLYSGIIFLVYSDASLSIVASWMLFSINLSIFLTYLILTYFYKLRFRFRFSLMAYLLYIQRSYKVLYFQFGDYFRIHLPIVFMSLNLNPIQLVTYSVNRTLSNLLSQIYLLLQTTIIQKVTANFAEGNTIEPKKIYKIVLFSMIPILSFSSLILYEFYDFIIDLWIRENSNNISNKRIFGLLIISSFVYCIWNLGTIFLVATNNFSKLSELSFYHGIGFFIFGVIGFYYSRLEGFIIGGILTEIIFGILLINYEIYKQLSIKLRDIISIILYFIICILSLAYPFILMDSAIQGSVVSLIIVILWLVFVIVRNRNILLNKYEFKKNRI